MTVVLIGIVFVVFVVCMAALTAGKRTDENMEGMQ